MIIVKLRKIINFIKSPWLRILYKRYINPLYDVKHAKKPLNKIFSFEELKFFAIKKPKNNDPRIETTKLLFIKILKKVPA